MTRGSLRKAVDAYCRRCGGSDGGVRHWRNHVSVCPVTDCPLWTHRPLTSEKLPEWLSCRDPARLPEGFQELRADQAIALMKGICSSDPARNGGDQRGREVSGPKSRGGKK